jgi:hypothetical protein
MVAAHLVNNLPNSEGKWKGKVKEKGKQKQKQKEKEKKSEAPSIGIQHPTYNIEHLVVIFSA